MRLSTKITAAAVGWLLLLSQAFSVGNLLEMQRNMIANIMEYEWLDMDQNAAKFSRELRRIAGRNSIDREFQNIYGKMIFQSGYSENGVLYYDGKELLNSTPYEFQIENGTPVSFRYCINELLEAVREKTFLEKINGKYLLILYEDIVYEGIEGFRILYYRDITSVYQQCRSFFVQGIVSSLLLAVLLTFLLSWIIQKILTPFYKLQDAANMIAGGVYTKRVEYPGRDEIGAVSRSFNLMADKVEEHVERLMELNEKQQQLLGALAHELKTPMTGIQGYAQLLQKVELPPERQAAALAYMEEECKRLSRLSVKMLQLTELSGEKHIEKKTLEVSRLFQKVEKITRFRLKEKEIQLETRCEENLTAEGDLDLLVSFLVNLIDNACKASEADGTILLMGSREGLFVQDEGRGIPKEELSKIAEPFYMVDKSRSRKEGGAGLGLALCAQIARVHGGRLEIVSEEGKGSRIGLVWRPENPELI